LLPSPSVHPYLAALASFVSFASANEDGAAGTIEVALPERQRFADPRSCAPEQNDQRVEPMAVGAITDSAHHRDDLFERRRIGGTLLALVPWRAPW